MCRVQYLALSDTLNLLRICRTKHFGNNRFTSVHTHLSCRCLQRISGFLLDTWQDVLYHRQRIALHCCKAHAKISRKMGNSTPCKTVNPENFSSKLCTRDNVGDGKLATNVQISVQIGSMRASPQIGEIRRLCDYFDCPVLSFFSRAHAQVEPLDRFSPHPLIVSAPWPHTKQRVHQETYIVDLSDHSPAVKL